LILGITFGLGAGSFAPLQSLEVRLVPEAGDEPRSGDAAYLAEFDRVGRGTTTERIRALTPRGLEPRPAEDAVDATGRRQPEGLPDRIAVLDQGRLVEEAPAQELLTAPRSALAQRLVAAARAREGQATPAPNQAPLLLELDELRCWHPLASLPWQQRWLKAVDGVSLQLHEGETIGLVGASGCGKSTLCRALIGLAPVRGGAVRLQGVDLLGLRGRPLRRARRRIQMVFQDPLACLNPLMPVGEAIADPLLIHGLASKPQARAKARELLAAVGLNPPEAFERRLPRQLSGGQQQRVAIARALVLEPQVLLCDESVSMLDAEVQAEVLALLRDLQGRLGLALIFVTHDLGVASGFCQRVIVLEGGRIVEQGPGDQLLAHPQAAITRSLVEACPRLPALA
jgi:peptide/nickel transport system ATP-binding protein